MTVSRTIVFGALVAFRWQIQINGGYRPTWFEFKNQVHGELLAVVTHNPLRNTHAFIN